MATITKTFTFDSTTEGFAYTVVGDEVAELDTSNGSPSASSLRLYVIGRNDTVDSNWKLSGVSWEDLDVPSGSTVTNVQVTGIQTYAGLTNWNVANSVSVDVHVYAAGGTTDVGTGSLYARTATAQDGAWQSASGTSQAVQSTYEASTTSLDVTFVTNLDNGNNATAATSLHIDTVALEITYTSEGTLFNQSVAGALPSSIGTLVSTKTPRTYTQSVVGVLPTSSGAVVPVKTPSNYTQATAGNMPQQTGDLVPVKTAMVYTQGTAGVMPAGTGTLVAVESEGPVLFYQSVAGNMPSSAATLLGSSSFGAAIFGDFPSGVGWIFKKTSKGLQGSLPSTSSTLNKKTSRLLSGIMPEGLGSLISKVSISTKIEGVMPALIGLITSVLNPIVSHGNKAIKTLGSSFKRFLQ